MLDCPGGTFLGAGVKVADIDKSTFDLSVKNPDGGEEITHRSLEAIMKEIAELEALKKFLLHQAFSGDL